ncbi:hypothetical protein CTZ28_28680 [Streptomyces shenzhenensis]|uniref:Uncharacterized protein n=1 Tax=Streptomyces shenzhenensis TaxID=943815 RepID=A0A3M0I6P1_9ACTN|nr:hypothetical protein CTZ28_28680 [Streptomyces shenzhenensis]
MRYLCAVRQYPGSGLGEGQCAGDVGERDPRCAKDIAERVIGALAHLNDACARFTRSLGLVSAVVYVPGAVWWAARRRASSSV